MTSDIALAALLSDAADEINACHRLIQLLARGWDIDGSYIATREHAGPEITLSDDLARTLAAVLGEES